MFKKQSEQTGNLPSQIVGREVDALLNELELKSLYVRTASRFGSTQIVQFKKVS